VREIPQRDNVLERHVDLAADGTLVYVSASSTNLDRSTLMWVDREGGEEPLPPDEMGSTGPSRKGGSSEGRRATHPAR
jgi:hypothetical protein